MNPCPNLQGVEVAAREANDAIEAFRNSPEFTAVSNEGRRLLRKVEDELANVLDGLADHDCEAHREEGDL